MPQFRWKGVTIEGAWRYGRTCAVADEQLSRRLFERGIAVTKISPVKTYDLMYSVPGEKKAQSLETVALLVEAGMQLSQACLVAAETLDNRLLQECWVLISDRIDRGEGIVDHVSLARIFGPFIAHLLMLGYKSGTFCATARVSARYARASSALRAQVRGALAMPLLTILFVCGLLWLLFVFLVPSLTSLFNQFSADLPMSTRALLAISAVLQSIWFFVGFCMCVGVGTLLVFISKRYGWGVSLVVRIPFVGLLYIQWQRMLFLQALYALVQGGMPLLDALQCIAEHVPTAAVRLYGAQLAYEVAGGITLSDALARADTPLSTPLMVAMVRVGQESNNLAPLLHTLAEREAAHFLGRLKAFTLILQPVLIIILGCVVLAVIGAIYMPLINLAQIVQ